MYKKLYMAFGVLFEMPFFALSGKQNLKQQLKITGITRVCLNLLTQAFLAKSIFIILW